MPVKAFFMQQIQCPGLDEAFPSCSFTPSTWLLQDLFQLSPPLGNGGKKFKIWSYNNHGSEKKYSQLDNNLKII